MSDNPFDVFAADFKAAIPSTDDKNASSATNQPINIMAEPAPAPVPVMNAPAAPVMNQQPQPQMGGMGGMGGGMYGGYGMNAPTMNAPPTMGATQGAMVASAQQSNPYAMNMGGYGAPAPPAMGMGMGMTPAPAYQMGGAPAPGMPPSMTAPSPYGMPTMPPAGAAPAPFGAPPAASQQTAPPSQPEQAPVPPAPMTDPFGAPPAPMPPVPTPAAPAVPPPAVPELNSAPQVPPPAPTTVDPLGDPFGAPPPQPNQAAAADPWSQPAPAASLGNDAIVPVANDAAAGDPFLVFDQPDALSVATPAPPKEYTQQRVAEMADDPWNSTFGGAPSPNNASAATPEATPANNTGGGGSLLDDGGLVPVQEDVHKSGELPPGGEWYDARIFTPTLGVMFFKPQELTDSLFLQTDRSLVDALDDRPVVAFIVEGSSARAAGVELGHVLLKVNGIDVKNPKEASRLIKEGPRPLPLLFYVPDTTVVVAEGEHMVKYDTRDTVAPNSAKDWKPKYVVIGGIIAQPWMMNMYRSKVRRIG